MFWYFDDSLSLSSKPFMLALFTICTSIGVSSPSSARKPCHSRHTRHIHDRRQVDINTTAGWPQCHVQLESIYSQAQRRTSTVEEDTAGCPSCRPTNSVKALKEDAVWQKSSEFTATQHHHSTILAASHLQTQSHTTTKELNHTCMYRHISYMRICDRCILRIFQQSGHIAYFPHKLGFSTAILISLVFLLPISIRFRYLPRPYDCQQNGTFHVSGLRWNEIG